MKGKQWPEAYVLAAELTQLYRADANTLQKVAFYIASEQPSYKDLTDWLEAQVQAAGYFPRSNQSVSHNVAAQALVEWIAERYTLQNSPARIAEMVAWVVRLMMYYRANGREADELVDRRNPLLMMPSIPRYTPQVRVRRAVAPPPQSESKPDGPDSVSKAADDFMEFLKRKNKG